MESEARTGDSRSWHHEKAQLRCKGEPQSRLVHCIVMEIMFRPTQSVELSSFLPNGLVHTIFCSA